jgi:hypothetical protein
MNKASRFVAGVIGSASIVGNVTTSYNDAAASDTSFAAPAINSIETRCAPMVRTVYAPKPSDTWSIVDENKLSSNLSSESSEQMENMDMDLAWNPTLESSSSVAMEEIRLLSQKRIV